MIPLQAHKLDAPAMGHPSGLAVINGCMLALLQKVLADGGAIADEKVALDLLTSAAYDEIMKTIPKSWSNVVSLVERGEAVNKNEFKKMISTVGGPWQEL